MKLRGRSFELGARTLVMGVLNLTPDSFSGDGVAGDHDLAVHLAGEMVAAGADLVDVGGESTRPGSVPVTAEEEIRRVGPVVKHLVGHGITVSVDTYKPEVAKRVLELGAEMINDVSGLGKPEMAAVISGQGAGIAIMHSGGRPGSKWIEPAYPGGVVEAVKRFLKSKVEEAESAGVGRDSIVVDPGIGFRKRVEDNLKVIAGIESLKEVGKPILVGPSRKGFLGKLTGLPVEERLEATLAAVVACVANGADMVRVHDVRECKRAVAVADAIVRRPAVTRGRRPSIAHA